MANNRVLRIRQNADYSRRRYLLPDGWQLGSYPETGFGEIEGQR
jgi:hypothetical protein